VAQNQLNMKIFSCPSCGGEVQVRSIFSKSVICAYCGQTSYLNVNQLEAKGTKSLLADYGSNFAVGLKGKVQNQPFQVIGRLRFDYEEGFWDEWAVIINQKEDEIYWLEESEGRLTLLKSSVVVPSKAPNYKNIKIGSEIKFEGSKIFIRAKSKATLSGGEGELPLEVIKGAQTDFVDGICEGKPVSFEFMKGETTFNQGKTLYLHDFEFAK
jgi:hypothetical protein